MLQKPIIRKFQKCKVDSSFMYNIWVTGLANTQLIWRYKKEYLSLLCITDVYCKYKWVIPLNYKKVKWLPKHSKKLWKKSNRKLNKFGWVMIGNNDIEIYSTHNKGKSPTAEQFLLMFSMTYKYMTIWLRNIWLLYKKF